MVLHELGDLRQVVGWLGCLSLVPAWSRDLRPQVYGLSIGSVRGLEGLLVFFALAAG